VLILRAQLLPTLRERVFLKETENAINKKTDEFNKEIQKRFQGREIK
jgi:hypothetical protein